MSNTETFALKLRKTNHQPVASHVRNGNIRNVQAFALKLRNTKLQSVARHTVKSGKANGYLSETEVRERQTEKYFEDRQIFAEKKRQKELKKREEKWKRYAHVKLGQRLDDSFDQMESIDAVRESQQLMYEMQSQQEALALENRREAARLKREEQKREEKWKRYAHVDLGQRFNDSADLVENINSVRQRQQLMYETQSERALELENQRKAARLKREQEKRQEKMRKYAHVQIGRRLNEPERNEEPNQDLDSSVGHLDRNIQNINLNANYDLVMEKKDSMYQGKKLNSESKINNVDSPGTSQETTNNLNAEQTNQCETNGQLSAEIEAEYNREMKLARERLQKMYDESKNEQ